MNTDLSVLEICAGAGGQSKGLEDAGFGHELAVEIDPDACNTLRLNRPSWKVDERDVHEVDGRAYKGIDLIAGGVPCPPFSIAGKQLGEDDERAAENFFRLRYCIQPDLDVAMSQRKSSNRETVRLPRLPFHTPATNCRSTNGRIPPCW